jgi:4-methyl-5(b-hydroxyethyl)-thiazole monophosphate biosynthesis
MVYMFLGTGFEETEAIAPLDLLRRANIEVKTVGLNGPVITGSHGIPVVADMEIADLDISDAEMVILPGGLGGVASIRACEAAMEAIRAAWDAGKFAAAICAGPTVLADLGITAGKNATCYPGCEEGMGSANMVCEAAVRDGMLITGTSAGCAVPFGLRLIEALKGEAESCRIAQQIVIR